MNPATPQPFPRVALPGVDQEAAEALHARREAYRALSLAKVVSLLRTGKHVYRGTVPAATITARRAANRRARIARRVNR